MPKIVRKLVSKEMQSFDVIEFNLPARLESLVLQCDSRLDFYFRN